MRTFSRSLWLVPVLALGLAVPASAQSWKWDIGVYGGYSMFTATLDEEDTGLPDEAGGAEVHWESGPLFGVQIGYNFSPKLGLRLNTRYADRPLEGSDIESGNFVTSTNLWAGSLDLLFRLGQPAPEFAGMEILPYIALGLGAKWMNPAEDNFTCNDIVENESFACAPFVTGLPSAPRGWALGEKNSLMGLIGLGADWRLGRSFALRTEINDQIYSPQIYRANQVGTSTTWNLPSTDNEASLTHEIAGTIGLHLLMGLAPVPVVAIAPPPPAPTPTPPPAPAAPREEQISVCVIDPTAPGGIRMQTATLVERRDTFVVVGGTRTPLRQAVGNVMVASNADWYTRGQPLTMTIGTNERVEFTTYGGTRVISSEDLAFLGTINGVPVYADEDDVDDVIDELNDLNAAQRGTDLGKILGEQKDLREALEDVKVVYVPMYATGCVFQGVQRQEEVRKGGK